MKFLYTARGTYDHNYGGDDIAWKKYLDWSKLYHLKELVSVDELLNELLIEPDYDNKNDCDNIYADESYITPFFLTLEYVLLKVKKQEKFNLLAIVIEPKEDCKNVQLGEFEFMGYDLLDYHYSISALVNCGGFEETFQASDLNCYGLISEYSNAYDIQKRLLENNPNEDHADTNVIAIWRHKTIGR